MEKEQILSTLKEKLGQTSLSDRTLTTYVENNLLSEGDPDESYWSRHTAILKSLGGQFSHDVATQVDQFKKDYKPIETQTTPQVTTQAAPQDDALKALMDRLDAMEQSNKDLKSQLENSRSEAQQETLRSQVVDLVRKKGANDEYVLQNALLKQGAFDTKKSADVLAEEFLKSYDREYSACRGVAESQARFGSNGGGEGTNSFLQRLKEQHQKNGDLPKQ